MTKLARIAAAVLTLGALLTVVAPAPPASARQFTMLLYRDKPITMDIGPMVGQNPGASATSPKPAFCTTPPQGGPCDTFKVAIFRDGIDENEDYFVTVTVTWVDPSGSNDVDLYLYKDPVAPDSAPVATSGASQPPAPLIEKAQLFRPRGIHHIVVNNYLGANTGYKITASIDVVKAEIVTESLEPDRVNPSDDEEVGGEIFEEEPPPPAEEPEPAFDFPSLDNLPEDLGDELDPFTPSDTTDADFDFPPIIENPKGAGAGSLFENLRGGQVVAAKVKPASAGSLAVWLVIIPLAFLLGTGGLLIKRRPVALSI